MYNMDYNPNPVPCWLWCLLCCLLSGIITYAIMVQKRQEAVRFVHEQAVGFGYGKWVSNHEGGKLFVWHDPYLVTTPKTNH